MSLDITEHQREAVTILVFKGRLTVGESNRVRGLLTKHRLD
jgi:hypothetical protein